MTATATRSGAQLTMQGQLVPAESVDPTTFFQRTRRKRNKENTGGGSFAGLGQTDIVEIRKSDIISAIYVRFSGTLAVTHNTGNVNSTMRWPYDLIKLVKFTANGQSNLINCSGAKLKARELMKNPNATDRGVSQSVNNATVTQGTLSGASESWGVGAGATGIATGNYAVEIEWKIPVAEDERDLSGAIFCQTNETDLTLEIVWNDLTSLFTVTGNDTVALTGSLIVESEKYSIPSVNGLMVIPDLSLFHSMIQSAATGLGQGENEIRLIGQGAGKTLLRAFYQTWQGAAPQTPLLANGGNYGVQAWRYGSNETPESFVDGRSMRQWNEQLYGADLAAVFGFLSHEFEATWAFRDAVDQGQTSELRLVVNYVNALTSPRLEYVQETMFAAGTAA